MPLTLLRQAQDVRKSQSYVSNIAPSETAYQTDSDSLQYDLNAVRSALNNFLNRSVEAFPSAGHWWADISGTTFGSGTQPTANTGDPRGINKTSQDLFDVEQKRVLFYATLLADIEVPASQDYVVLGAGEIPNFNGGVAAIGNGKTTIGVVVAYNATFGAASLAEVTGETAVSPKNLCVVVDASTRDAISSAGRPIFALIQSESNVDGSTLGDSTPNRVQLSFVRPNADGTDLELCPAADIAGKTINFSYVARQAFDAMNEQNFLNGGFVDVAAGAITTTLQQAYDSSASPATITTTGDKALVFDLSSASLGAKMFQVGGAEKAVMLLGYDDNFDPVVGSSRLLQFSARSSDTSSVAVSRYVADGPGNTLLLLDNQNNAGDALTKLYSSGDNSSLEIESVSAGNASVKIGAGGLGAVGKIDIGGFGGGYNYDTNVYIGVNPGFKTGSVLIHGGDGTALTKGGVEINAAGEIQIGNDAVNQAIQIGKSGDRYLSLGNANPALGGYVEVDNSFSTGSVTAVSKYANSGTETPGGGIKLESHAQLRLESLLPYENVGQGSNVATDGAVTFQDGWMAWSSTYNAPGASTSGSLFLALDKAEWNTFATNFTPGTDVKGASNFSIIGALNQLSSGISSSTLQSAYDNSADPAFITTAGNKAIKLDLASATTGDAMFSISSSGNANVAFGTSSAPLMNLNARAAGTIDLKAYRAPGDTGSTTVNVTSYNQTGGGGSEVIITATGASSVVGIQATEENGVGDGGQVLIYANGGASNKGLIDIGYYSNADIEIGVGKVPGATGHLYLDGGSAGVEINATGVIKIGNDNVAQNIEIGKSGARYISLGDPNPVVSGYITLDNSGSGNIAAVGKYSNTGAETPGGGIELTSFGQLKLQSLLTYENAGQGTNLATDGAITLTDTWQANSAAFTAASSEQALFLSLNVAEWTEFADTFTPGTDVKGDPNFSIIGALNQTANHAPSRVYHTVTADAAAGTDTYGGVGGNLSAPYPDSFATMGILNTVVFLDGRLMQPGANAAAGMDYYPGSAFTAGDVRIKWNRDLLTDDVIATLVFELKYAA